MGQDFLTAHLYTQALFYAVDSDRTGELWPSCHGALTSKLTIRGVLACVLVPGMLSLSTLQPLCQRVKYDALHLTGFQVELSRSK